MAYIIRTTGRLYYHGKYYTPWVSYDGDPNFLYIHLVKQIRTVIADGSFETWKDKLSELKVVTMDSEPPSDEEYEKLKPYHSKYIRSLYKRDGLRSYNECWIDILYKCSYSYINVFESGYFIDGEEENLLNLGQNKYYYTLDLDRNVFVYEGPGFNKELEVYNIPDILTEFGEEAMDNV